MNFFNLHTKVETVNFIFQAGTILLPLMNEGNECISGTTMRICVKKL